MAERRILVRLLLGGAGPLVALSVLAGCGGNDNGGAAASDDPAASPTAPASESSVTATDGVTSATTAAGDAPAAVSPVVDGGALLQQALTGLAGGYHFTTTVSVDGVPTLVADGDRVADSTRLTITGDAGTIAYVITPAGSWVLPDEDGEWEAVEAPAATVDPIAALWAPTNVDVETQEGSATRLAASVPASALGIAGDAPTTLQLLLDGAELRDITFVSSVDGRPAAVQATITPLVDTSPVIAPV